MFDQVCRILDMDAAGQSAPDLHIITHVRDVSPTGRLRLTQLLGDGIHVGLGTVVVFGDDLQDVLDPCLPPRLVEQR